MEIEEKYILSKSGLDEDRDDADIYQKRVKEAIRRAHQLEIDDCVKRIIEIDHGIL